MLIALAAAVKAMTGFGQVVTRRAALAVVYCRVIGHRAEVKPVSTELRVNIYDDLSLLSDNGNRYEIIDGELYVTAVPHWRHQYACGQIVCALQEWVEQGNGGIAIMAPGIILAEDEAVAPDIVWVARGRVERLLRGDGKLHGAPELVVEVLSPGPKNEERDREIKLKLYSRRGVREYWIVNWQDVSIQVYRRQEAALHLVATLTADDTLTSPLLPGFAWRVEGVRAPISLEG